MFKKLATVAMICLPLPALAGIDFLDRQRFVIPVAPISATTFEVIENDGAGGTQMWCAAAKYSRAVLGNARGDLTILEARDTARTVQGRKGVVFTTAPVDGAFSSVSQSVRRAGKVFSVGHAYALCPRFGGRVTVRVLR
ncbi:hypothetical protein [Sulfitobacter sp. S190]|uniref:hypothetical protein n=1 Tax=Sulfitobacter sp. S190 TaxID=2867022 RepID=UPI0021A9164F|nr:hypothetical protein [Sulfitobacter sp. S190]UWR23543.1 hypothetical protein K3756_06080 [Sulfitobacter sp. S190]